MSPQIHQLTLAGQERTLFLKSAGTGRDIVLIHGAMTTHCDWMGELFENFARRGPAIAVDRPGHGRSLRPRFVASPYNQADQIREGLKRLGVTQPILVGHSFGALVASAWAAAYPDEVAGVLLASPILFHEFRLLEHPVFGPRAAPFLGPMVSRAAALTVDPAVTALAQRMMFAPHPPPQDWLARYDYERILSAEAMVAEGEDAAAMFPGSFAGLIDYSAITAPIRMLVGEQDHVVYPIRHAKRLAWLLPHAQLIARLDVGHMIHHTAAEALFEVLDDLLAGLED